MWPGHKKAFSEKEIKNITEIERHELFIGIRVPGKQKNCP